MAKIFGDPAGLSCAHFAAYILICFDKCPTLRDNVQIRGTYSDVHKQKIQVELANSLVQIDKVREEYLTS